MMYISNKKRVFYDNVEDSPVEKPRTTNVKYISYRITLIFFLLVETPNVNTLVKQCLLIR